MFKKLVAIEPVSLVASAEKKLRDYASEVIMYEDMPADNGQIIARIGDADAVLLSHTSSIDKEVLDACPNIKYIGMCCSLYAPESANVDIIHANSKGITVYGVRDYGDQGVVEFVVSELIRYLHGFGGKRWKELPLEITDLKVGIIGLGTSGRMVANALQALGADLHYYSRSRKPDAEECGMKYLPLDELLETVDVACTCLNKNVILLHEEQFAKLGNDKVLFNTSIGPSHEVPALLKWLENGDNEFFCDTVAATGDNSGAILENPHVNCMQVSSGRTKQAFDRLSQKVLDNIEKYFEKTKA